MFSPCTDLEYNGKRIRCYGEYMYDCSGCELLKLRSKANELELRIKNELEPRLKAEKRSYDIRVTSIDELSANEES